MPSFLATAVAFLLALSATSLFGRSISVASPEELTAACAAAQPGDTLVLRKGVWSDVALVFQARGKADSPITLTAEIPGQTKITGRSRLLVAGEHLVVSALLFEEAYPAEGPIIVVGGNNGEITTHCRITEVALVRCNPAESTRRITWLQLHGREHRVDHCRFEGGNHRGITLQVQVGAEDNRHRIDHNHFVRRAAGTGNNFETLQLAGPDGRNTCNSIVEENLFEDCDGEQEIISNKSSGNTYRKNTFRRCAGALTLRSGTDVVVESNIFLGEGKPLTGGVRVINTGHVVRGNYFQGLTGRYTAGGVISLYAGVPPASFRLYTPVENALIVDNILIDNASNGIDLSTGYRSRNRSVLPSRVTLRHNYIQNHPHHSVVAVAGTPGPDLVCEGNVYSHTSEIGYAPPTGFTQSAAPANFDYDAPLPLQPPLAPPPSTEWNGVMAALRPLTVGDVGPRWLQ